MMLRVGIVAEGKSEFFVLEEIMRAVHPDIDFVEIEHVARQLPAVCARCSQAARFVDEFRAAVAVLRLSSAP